VAHNRTITPIIIRYFTGRPTSLRRRSSPQ
jgi:hypothetical protein